MAPAARCCSVAGRMRTSTVRGTVEPTTTRSPLCSTTLSKYVVSNTLVEPLAWANSTLVTGDAGDAVAELKRGSDQDLTILGSATLVQSLLRRSLVDELVLTIHPLVLGPGRRLFATDSAFASFELIESLPTTTGVLIASYRLRG